MRGQPLECLSTWLEDVRKWERGRAWQRSEPDRVWGKCNQSRCLPAVTSACCAHSKRLRWRGTSSCVCVLCLDALFFLNPYWHLFFKRKHFFGGFQGWSVSTCWGSVMLASSISLRYIYDRWVVHYPEVPRGMWKCPVISWSIYIVSCASHGRKELGLFFFVYFAQLLGSGFLIYNPMERAVHKAWCQGRFITATVWLISKSRGDENM